MNLTEIANFRYSTKEFDPNKKISAEHFQQIKSLLRYSASSVNSQPWHFIVADSDKAKQRISKASQDFYSFNEQKILNASHVIVFCTRTDMDEKYMLHILETEEKDGRYPDPAFKDMMHNGRMKFSNIHRLNLKDHQHWMEKQVYLNMGTVLLGAGALGIDAVPVEGVDTAILNEEFDLPAKGFTASAIVCLGYRAETDINARLPKSRLAEKEIFTIL